MNNHLPAPLICSATPPRDPLAPRNDLDEAERKEFEQAFNGLDFSIRRKHGIYVYEKRRVEDYWQGWKLCARINKNRKERAERLGLTE